MMWDTFFVLTISAALIGLYILTNRDMGDDE